MTATKPLPVASTEPAIAFTDLPRWIAREFGVRAPHAATLHRWRLGGTGGVFLPTFKIGGLRYTRPGDVRKFIQEINK